MKRQEWVGIKPSEPRGVRGHAPPGNILIFPCSEIISGAF